METEKAPVLARAGDKVIWEKGHLTVNGVASSHVPLNGARAPGRLAFTVPANCVFILPTTTPNLTAADPLSLWQSLACVPRAQIEGTVYMRYQPLSRLAVLH